MRFKYKKGDIVRYNSTFYNYVFKVCGIEQQEYTYYQVVNIKNGEKYVVSKENLETYGRLEGDFDEV